MGVSTGSPVTLHTKEAQAAGAARAWIRFGRDAEIA
jgi:hypothetical protein